MVLNLLCPFIMTLEEIFQTELVAGNQLWRVGGLFLTLLIALAAGMLLKYLLRSRASDFEEKRPVFAATLAAIAKSATFLTFAIGLSSGTALLKLGPAAEFVSTCVAIVMTLAIAWLANCLVDVPRIWMIARASKTPSKLDDMLAPIVAKSLRITIVVLTIVQIAQILSGKEITSILAGLGIGGLAFAFPTQTVHLASDPSRPLEVGVRNG